LAITRLINLSGAVYGMVRRLKPRRGQSMSWMVITVVVIALVVAVAVMLYMRAMGAVNAMATLTGSGVASGGTFTVLTVTVTASGGTVKIMGIVLLNSRGVVTAIGTTPGYSGWSPYCRLVGVYINSAPGPLNPPWVLQNGQSASFIFRTIIIFAAFRMARGPGKQVGNQPSGSGPITNYDCSDVSQAIIFYNSGKTAIIPIIG